MKSTVAVAGIALAFFAVVAAVSFDQKGGSGQLEGVWKEVEIVVTGANASNNPSPQPSLYIFTRTHYSWMGTLGNRPRTLYRAVEPTNQEKVTAYDSFWGNAGTYEVTGTTITIRPIVARHPNFMAGGFCKYQFRLDGDTLWLTYKSTDEYFRVAGRVIPDPRPLSETRTKLVRVQ